MTQMCNNLYDLRMNASLDQTSRWFRLTQQVVGPLGAITHAGELFKIGNGPTMQPGRVFGRYALVYVTEGHGFYFDDHLGQRSIHAGDLIVVFPQLPHHYGPGPGDLWREVYLVFEGHVFGLWEQMQLLSQHKPIWHLSSIPLWRSRLISILETTPPTSTTALLEVCRLQHFLADALAANDPAQVGHEMTWLTEARALLILHTDIHTVARMMGCSYATFRRRFTHLAGLPPRRYQLQQRVERACEMMHRLSLTDKQIADKLGFCDEFHFSHRFKQITGLSPRAYRRSLP